MPLSPPVAREHFHTRDYEIHGYRRDDGLWDIEARMTDTKSYSFENDYRGRILAGEPLHDMAIRLTIDEDLIVRGMEAASDATPYAVCPAIAPNYERMVGVRLGAGWRQAIRERLGGVEGCTHLSEMLGAMATVAYQSLYPVLAKKAKDAPRPGKPALIDTCHAYRSDGDVARQTWPAHYTGE